MFQKYDWDNWIEQTFMGNNRMYQWIWPILSWWIMWIDRATILHSYEQHMAWPNEGVSLKEEIKKQMIEIYIRL